jgi:hypothetical protein
MREEEVSKLFHNLFIRFINIVNVNPFFLLFSYMTRRNFPLFMCVQKDLGFHFFPE